MAKPIHRSCNPKDSFAGVFCLNINQSKTALITKHKIADYFLNNWSQVYTISKQLTFLLRFKFRGLFKPVLTKLKLKLGLKCCGFTNPYFMQTYLSNGIFSFFSLAYLVDLGCCVFQPAFGCFAHPKAGQTTFFQPFTTFVHFKPFSVISRLKSTKNVWKRTKKGD